MYAWYVTRGHSRTSNKLVCICFTQIQALHSVAPEPPPPPAFGNCQNGLVGSAERRENTPQKIYYVITKESLGEVDVHIGNLKNEKTLPDKREFCHFTYPPPP